MGQAMKCRVDRHFVIGGGNKIAAIVLSKTKNKEISACHTIFVAAFNAV